MGKNNMGQKCQINMGQSSRDFFSDFETLW